MGSSVGTVDAQGAEGCFLEKNIAAFGHKRHGGGVVKFHMTSTLCNYDHTTSRGGPSRFRLSHWRLFRLMDHRWKLDQLEDESSFTRGAWS